MFICNSLDLRSVLFATRFYMLWIENYLQRLVLLVIISFMVPVSISGSDPQVTIPVLCVVGKFHLEDKYRNFCNALSKIN